MVESATVVSPKLFMNNYGIYVDIILDGFLLNHLVGEKIMFKNKDKYRFDITFTKLSTCPTCDYIQLVKDIAKILEKKPLSNSEYPDYNYKFTAYIEDAENKLDENNTIILKINGTAEYVKK